MSKIQLIEVDNSPVFSDRYEGSIVFSEVFVKHQDGRQIYAFTYPKEAKNNFGWGYNRFLAAQYDADRKKKNLLDSDGMWFCDYQSNIQKALTEGPAYLLEWIHSRNLNFETCTVFCSARADRETGRRVYFDLDDSPNFVDGEFWRFSGNCVEFSCTFRYIILDREAAQKLYEKYLKVKDSGDGSASSVSSPICPQGGAVYV